MTGSALERWEFIKIFTAVAVKANVSEQGGGLGEGTGSGSPRIGLGRVRADDGKRS